MATRLLYISAALIVVVGGAYALFVEPRPCGMDDISSACGAGARYSAVIASVFVALILIYVARALRRDRDA